MSEFFRKSLLMGMGLAALTTEKIEKTVEELIKKGELSEQEGKEAVKEFIEKSKEIKREIGDKIEKTVSDSLKELNIPTRDEIDALKKRIEGLEALLQHKE